MLWCCCLKKWSFFPPSFHCFSSAPCLYHSCQTGFETSLVENEALDLLPVIILPDQLPALTISVDRLGNSGTTRKWEHYVRISPVCKSQGQHGVPKHRWQQLGWAGREEAMLRLFHWPHCCSRTHTALGVCSYQMSVAPVEVQAEEAAPFSSTSGVPMGINRHWEWNITCQCNRHPGPCTY